MASFVYYHLGAVDWITSLFYRETPQGFIFDFQILIGGFLAFCAGYFVYSSTRLTLQREKEKELEETKKFRTYYAKEARIISAYAEVYIDETQSDETIGTSIILLKGFKNEFLSNLQHIDYFNKKEIWEICDLDSQLELANDYIDDFKYVIKDSPQIKFSELKSSPSCSKILQKVQKSSAQLSRSLDAERWENWMKKK